jgi:hypothetical protein
MKKPVSIISALVLTILVLSIIRIYIANRIATSGVVLENVQAQTEAYKTENIQLAEKFYSQAALTNIDQQASKLGFVVPTADFVVNGQLPVAYKQ